MKGLVRDGAAVDVSECARVAAVGGGGGARVYAGGLYD